MLGLRTQRNKHTKKHESNNYAGTLPWKVFIASQGHWIWSDNIFSASQRETWSLQWVNDQILIHSIFSTKPRLYRGNAILEILYSKLKTNHLTQQNTGR